MIPRRLTALLLVAAAAGFAPAPTLAQTPPAPVVEVDLYGNTVLFRTLPFSIVTAELSHPGGARSDGVGFAGPEGVAQVQFVEGGQVVRPGDTLTFSWACGNNTTVTGETAVCNYTAAGSFTVTLTVTDQPDGCPARTDTDTVVVTVP